MTPFTVRGLPRSLQREAWWMAADAQSGVGATSPIKVPSKPIWILLAALILTDLMLWHAAAGLGFAFLVVAIATAIHRLNPMQETRTAMIAWVILCAAIVPAIDLVQGLSVGLALFGLVVFSLLMIGGAWEAIPRGLRRLPVASLVLSAKDAAALCQTRASWPNGKQALRDWFLPLSLGTVFAVLVAAANPIVDGWITSILSFNGIDLDIGRILFWIAAALMIWPILRLQSAAKHLFAPSRTARTRRLAIINPRSVARALVVFNLIFATQTVLDLTYLVGGAALPDGMTYAAYAHRGAYPLLVTSLLAGVFAIIAQPMLGTGSNLRILLLVWVAQTVLLVASSILRLDLYVAAFGLTIFRVAAFVWMGLVAVGLCLLIWQILRELSVSWLLLRTSLLGVCVLYVASLSNISGVVAEHNLSRGAGDVDQYYLCAMGDGASPAILAYRQSHGAKICSGRRNTVAPPKDLREWGYRNYRLRSTIANMLETSL